jgi:hypothetical protein
MPKIIHLNTDKIVSISAILISLMTLGALIYQTNIMREEQELNRMAQLKTTMPYLTLSNFNYGGPNYAVVLSNKGIGPALIDTVSITYQDSVYYMDLATFIYEAIPEAWDIEHLYHANISPGQLIPPGEALHLLSIDNDQESSDQLVKSLEGLDAYYRIVYRSVYDERWALTSDSFYPVKLEKGK